MRKALTIAGSDCSGGAGVQADIKTMTVHQVYAMSVMTALTAQNTTGVYGIQEVPPEFVARQLDCVFTDIVPDAVKIGMVSCADIIAVIAERLTRYGAGNIVLDPVMAASSGGRLIGGGAAEALIALLFPLAALITPNIPEAEALSGIPIAAPGDMPAAARAIAALTDGGVLIKGGHLAGGADDLLYWKGEMLWIHGERIPNPNTHGTGCTLSSAIACHLARGRDMVQSVREAKVYIARALRAGLDLGHGAGPLNHWG
ncbi:MAG: bifunctional hydroxymethylpyrimidine kinase/phosphomethylpyrimidine kinase [Oscillospiraceae bacterium]|nr:bifunctional hydroxymethylpyrimidine kinase/phosphomethylpyrimidine kinase [Oscillospiraceae bacterium]